MVDTGGAADSPVPALHPAGTGELRDDLVQADGAAEGLRQAMTNFASGVIVVTTQDSAGSHAMTANSFTSISLCPPLVLISVTQLGSFHAHVIESGLWAVSVLASDQAGIAAHFANKNRDRTRQFEPVPHRVSERTGLPLIGGALAWLECRTTQTTPAGDHTLIIGEVLDSTLNPAGGFPLTYFRGGFVAAAPPAP